MNSPTAQLARHPLFRPLALLARAIWRPVFAWRCRWLSYDTLQDRARLVMESPDWSRIQHVPNAGRVRGLTQIMHNGLRIRLGSYYGYGCVPFFHRTKGVHEPQEEIAFAAVLPLIPRGAVMVELGSYWAFYSMWFAQQVPGARNFLVEPDPQCLEAGKDNFALNGLRGHFTQAFVGRHLATGKAGITLLNIDSFLAQHQLEHIHLLHADIQGYEFEMLEGAQDAFARGQVDFLFLSTHGESLHHRCRDHLTTHTAMRVVLDIPPSASYSADGLIVAVRAGVEAPPLNVTLRRAVTPHTS